MLNKMPSEKIKVRRGTPFENFLYVFKQLKRGLVSHSKILEKTMLSEKLKLDMGPLLTILFYLFKQLETGLVCHFQMLKIMLSEKLNPFWTPFDYSVLFVQTA